MRLYLPLEGTGPLRTRLYEALRAALMDGRLAPGEALPPSRGLAAELGLGRQTVVDAYERLIAEGFFEARRGSGTFVSASLAGLDHAADATPAAIGPGRHWPPLPAWGGGERRRFNFAGGVTDRRLLPWPPWRAAVQRALRDQAHDRAPYADPQGHGPLRGGIADYLGYSRGLSCRPADILVTQGAQQGLDLLARVRVAPGDVVALEEPGYPPARAVFAARGARLVEVPVDERGVRVDRVPPDARLLYLTPSHQFPLGMPLSLERRLALLEFARQRDLLIVEDDYDGEFRFQGRALDALKSLDRHGQVAYLGTFSKVWNADLRLGYLVMPAGLRGALLQARALSDGASTGLTQIALAHFIHDGHFARHLRRMQRLYEQRRQRLLAALARHQDLWTVLPQVAGIHLALTFNRAVPDVRGRLAAASISAEPIEAFYQNTPARTGLLLGFGALDDEDIDAAVAVLARACGEPARE
ncbi:MocR-like pyridoxine biosynthesis transcription factor PdxR [Alloalcanivorax mobilis]|uniref:MocR-like pyridoxine biosynthesis transcription factor PdxR n=1 Tax=Alloalcanivorax mobilis TaxID=2019569 RepID=UPI000C75CB6C|nr:PLP-dependent aminotransferase family protein [Alloalcanivorax mobilis]